MSAASPRSADTAAPRTRKPRRPPLTARQAAAALGVSERYIRDLAADGRLTVVTAAPLTVTAASVDTVAQKRATRPQPQPRPRTLDTDTVRQVMTGVLAELLPHLHSSSTLADLEQRIAALESAVERLAVDLRQQGTPSA